MSGSIGRLAALAAIIFVPACATVEAISGAGGAASMTVDVEVYKGPLSKTKPVQSAELVAKLRDARRGYDQIDANVQITQARYECHLGDNLPIASAQVGSAREGAKQDTCLLLEALREDANYLSMQAASVLNQNPGGSIPAPAGNPTQDLADNECEGSLRRNTSCDQTAYGLRYLFHHGFRGDPRLHDEEVERDEVRQAAIIGALAKERANFWAVELAGLTTSRSLVRRDIADFANFASEYGNQLVSRADALFWQLREDPEFSNGVELAKRLALSHYLRDSSPTNFLNLYDWTSGYPRRNSAFSDLDRSDRVELVQQLVNDNYWSNINSVYASGQGDVSMAFIRDEIGNWNLKAFENDPTDLLNAYDEFAIDAVEKAGSLITGFDDGSITGLTGGVSALLNLSDIGATDGEGNAASSIPANLETFKSDFETKLNAERDAFKAKSEASKTELSQLETQIKNDESAQKNLDQSYEKDQITAETKIDERRSAVRAGVTCDGGGIQPIGCSAEWADPPAVETQDAKEIRLDALCDAGEAARDLDLREQCAMRADARMKRDQIFNSDNGGPPLSAYCQLARTNDGIEGEKELKPWEADCAKHAAALEQQSKNREQSATALKKIVSDYRILIDVLKRTSLP